MVGRGGRRKAINRRDFIREQVEDRRSSMSIRDL